jgi:hypothetical protein
LRLPSRCGRTLHRPRPEGATRIGAPRRSHKAAPPSPRRGSRVRCPRASERSATRGTGGLKAPLPHAMAQCLGGGYSTRQAGASGHVSRDRGDPTREPGRGVGDAVLCGHRGAPARDALLGRGRGSLGAWRAGASKRRVAAHPHGKKDSLTQWPRTPGSKPARQKTPWSGNESKAAPPRRKKKAKGAWGEAPRKGQVPSRQLSR